VSIVDVGGRIAGAPRGEAWIGASKASIRSNACSNDPETRRSYRNPEFRREVQHPPPI
jgi:hypothetical protein